jgi:hypothetical protein
MIMWYPVDGDDFPDQPSEDGHNVPISINPADAPNVVDLASWVQSEKDLSADETLSLGFTPVKLDEAANQRTIVLDVTRYADKGNIRWGVGMRFTLHAWTSNGSIQGSVALVAAQASLNLVFTRASFQILGGGNVPGLTKFFPKFEEMSVSNYPKLMESLDACRDALDAADAATLVVMPIAVSIPKPPPSATHHGIHVFHHQQG